MKTKNILSILLALGLGLSVVGCTPDDSSSSSTGDSSSDKEIEVVDGAYIVDDGVSEYKIVLPAEANACEITASMEMQNFVEESTGARLEIVNESDVVYNENAKYLYIGQTETADDLLETDVSRLKTDGFAVETHGKSVFFLGENVDGTLYSVYDFLEKVIGVRFLTAEATYVPKLQDIPLYDFFIVEEPAIDRRYYFGRNETTDSAKEAAFLARSRMSSEYGSGEAYGEGTNWCTAAGSTHNIMTHYIQMDQYYDKHPEWFYKGALWDICWTNGLTADGEVDWSMEESVFKTALEKMKNYALASSEHVDFFMFGHDDMGRGNKGCQCENCKPVHDKYGYAGLQLRFVNKLAEEMNKWSQETLGREVFVGCWAYGISEMAPAKKNASGEWEPIDETVRANDNVVFYFAPIYADRSYALLDERQALDTRNMVNAWRVIGSNFIVWQYEVAFPDYLAYLPRVQTYADDFKLFEEMNAQYVMLQSSWDVTNVWSSLMEAYVSSKLMWNPSLDANALKEEFIQLYYGMAGDTVSELVRSYEERWFETGSVYYDLNAYSQIEEYLAQNYGKQILKYRESLEKAIAEIEASSLSAEEKATYIKRVQAVRVCFMFLEMDQYESYHNTSLVGRYELAVEFFDLVDELGINGSSEAGDWASAKTKYLG